MNVFAYRNTERGIRERSAANVSEERAMRLAAQRAMYEAQLAEVARIDQIRSEAAARARAYAEEMKLAGFRYRPSLTDIERRAFSVFGVTKAELHSDRRFRSVVFARQFVMYWAVRLTPLSTPQIGRLMGGKDHTSVLHGKNAYVGKRAEMGRKLPPAR